MRLVIATGNPGKVREIREVLGMPGLQLITPEELGEWVPPDENGDTLEENAIIKGVALRDRFGHPAIADDSGLEVDHLNGRPGINSARYAGQEGDAEKNMDLLLSELQGVPLGDRTARFRCVIALVIPGDIRFARGICEGAILTERHGRGGFGYDPVFRPRGFTYTMAEISLEEKNAISHRGKALRMMRGVIESLVRSQPAD